MQATITYLLTEQAQRAAIAATGLPVPRQQTMTIEVSPDDLPLLPVAEDGTISLDLTHYSHSWAAALQRAGWQPSNGSSGARAVGLDPPVLADYRLGQALLKTEEAKAEALAHANGEHNRRVTEKAYQAFLADPNLRAGGHDLRNLIHDSRSPADWWPEKHPHFKAEIERRNKADQQAKKDADAIREGEKDQAITAFVARSGDELLQQQFADGLLNRRVIVARLADATFTAVGVPAECPDSVVCDDSDCACQDTHVPFVPPEVYARWKALNLPPGVAVEFHEVRGCLGLPYGADDDETAGPVEYHAHITLTAGPFRFERRILV